MYQKTKKITAITIISIFIFSMFFATVPLAFATGTPVDLTPDYAKAGDTIDILSFDIVGPTGGTTLTSVTIQYYGTAYDLADLSWAAVYVSTDGGPWTLFGWIWAASLTGTPPTGTITGSYSIGAGVTATVKLTYTLSAGALHGGYVDGRVTTYTLTIPPAVGTDAPPIDPAGETRIDNTEPTLTVSIPAYLESGSLGSAEWTTDEKKYGSYSVELTIPDGATDAAYAEVWVPVSILLGELDLAGTYFWCKSTAGDWTPYFIFELDTGDRINTDAFDSTGYADWTQYIAEDSPEFQWSTDGLWHSWVDTVTTFGADTITRVYVELSGLQNIGEIDYGPFTSYVDDITVAYDGSSLSFPLDLVLRGGASYYITWIATDGNDFSTDAQLLINLEYSPDGGANWILIAANQANDGEYLWTLPLINSDDVLVRATAFDLAGNSGSDESDTLTIDSTNPTITIVSPLDGAYTNDDTPTISAILFNGLAGIDPDSIVMKLDDVDPPVVEIPDTDYTYDLVTGLLSFTPAPGKIYETLADGIWYVTADVSDLAGNPATTATWSFTVDTTLPVVTIISPNGGEEWLGGSTENITWTATDPTPTLGPTPITLEYSPNGGTDWILIAANQANDGVYSWLVPSIISPNVLVRVNATDLAGNEGSDESDAVFTITYEPVLTTVDVTAVPLTVLADGIDFSTITATVLDQMGNPMAGRIVYFTTTLGTLSAPSAVTGLDGKATVTLTSTLMGTATVTATADSISDSVDVEFVGVGGIGDVIQILLGIKEEVKEIEAKLDNPDYGLAVIKEEVAAIYTWLTTDANIVDDSELEAAKNAIINDVESKLTSARLANIDLIDDINTYLTGTIYPAIDEVEGLLKHTTYGLSALNTDLDAILSRIGTFTGTDTVASLLYDIEAKLDVGGSFYTFVNNWFMTIQTAIGGIGGKLDLLVVDADLSGVPDFIEEISAIEVKLDVIGPKIDSIKTAVETTIPNTLADIKAKTDTINWADITALTTAVADIEGKLDNADYGLAALKTAIEGISVDLTPVLNAISGLDAKLGTFTTGDTVASLLYDIEEKLDAIGVGAQATSGSGTTTADATIYTGTKVGTVTVSISTSGIGSGENVRVRYYINPANPGLYIQKTVVTNTNTLGWTDTAAAWKVEIDITGTGTVNWAYSVIYPP